MNSPWRKKTRRIEFECLARMNLRVRSRGKREVRAERRGEVKGAKSFEVGDDADGGRMMRVVSV